MLYWKKMEGRMIIGRLIETVNGIKQEDRKEKKS